MPNAYLDVRYSVQSTGTWLATGHAEPALQPSTLKGAIRQEAARWWLTSSGKTCQSEGDPSCPVCLLFGGAGLEGGLRWTSLISASEREPVPLARTQRTRLHVDRARRTSRLHAASSVEVAAGEFRWSGQVCGWLPRVDANPRALLLSALLSVRHVGAGAALGAGGIRLAIEQATFGGEAIDVDAVLGALLPEVTV
jgi:hypothetical protein